MKGEGGWRACKAVKVVVGCNCRNNRTLSHGFGGWSFTQLNVIMTALRALIDKLRPMTALDCQLDRSPRQLLSIFVDTSQRVLGVPYLPALSLYMVEPCRGKANEYSAFLH